MDLSVCRFVGFVGLWVCWLVDLSILLVCEFLGLSVCWFVGLMICWFVDLFIC